MEVNKKWTWKKRRKRKEGADMPAKYDRCIKAILKKQHNSLKPYNPYAVCKVSLGMTSHKGLSKKKR